jgi:hypothetical protein
VLASTVVVTSCSEGFTTSGVTPEDVDTQPARSGRDHSDDDRGADPETVIQRLIGAQDRKPGRRERLEVGQYPVRDCPSFEVP